MAGTRPQVVTMSLNTVPPVDCKWAAAASSLSSRLAQSDRFVRVLFGPSWNNPSVLYALLLSGPDSASGRAAFPYAQNAQSRRLPQPAFSLDAGRVASVHAETDTRGG